MKIRNEEIGVFLNKKKEKEMNDFMGCSSFNRARGSSTN